MSRNYKIEKRIFSAMDSKIRNGKNPDPSEIYKNEIHGFFGSLDEFMLYVQDELEGRGYVRLTVNGRLKPGNNWEEWCEELAHN